MTHLCKISRMCKSVYKENICVGCLGVRREGWGRAWGGAPNGCEVFCGEMKMLYS